MDPRYHIRIIRDKKQLLPGVAEPFAQQIFTEIFRGDGLDDAVLDLFVDLYHPRDFEEADAEGDLDLYTEIMIDLKNAVWAHILYQLHELVRKNENLPIHDAPPNT